MISVQTKETDSTDKEDAPVGGVHTLLREVPGLLVAVDTVKIRIRPSVNGDRSPRSGHPAAGTAHYGVVAAAHVLYVVPIIRHPPERCSGCNRSGVPLNPFPALPVMPYR